MAGSLLLWLSFQGGGKLAEMVLQWWQGGFISRLQAEIDRNAGSLPEEAMQNFEKIKTILESSDGEYQLDAAAFSFAQIRSALLLSSAVLIYAGLDQATSRMLRVLEETKHGWLAFTVDAAEVPISEFRSKGLDAVVDERIAKRIEQLDHASIFDRLKVLSQALGECEFTDLVSRRETKSTLGNIKRLRESVVHHGVAKVGDAHDQTMNLVAEAYNLHSVICNCFDESVKSASLAAQDQGQAN